MSEAWILAGLETGDLQKDTERATEEGERERHKTARKTVHSDNPGKMRRKGGEAIEMVVGTEVGNCLVDHV